MQTDLQAVVSVLACGVLVSESWGCNINSPFYDIPISKPVYRRRGGRNDVIKLHLDRLAIYNGKSVVLASIKG